MAIRGVLEGWVITITAGYQHGVRGSLGLFGSTDT